MKDLKAKWAGKYAAYLDSSDWRRKRQQAFAFYGRCCDKCGFKQQLVVHHRTYENLGDEPMEDLQVLCENCHNVLHGGSHRGAGKRGRKKRRRQARKTTPSPQKPAIDQTLLLTREEARLLALILKSRRDPAKDLIAKLERIQRLG